MSLSKPFPLLRLPRLPLFKVLNGIGVQEQFYLSICSSKAKYAIKFYNDKQKFTVTFHFTDNFAFYMRTENSDDEFQIDVQNHTAVFGLMWTFMRNVEASSFDPFAKNVKRFLLFLVDVFNTPTICLNFEERPQYFVTELICFVHSLKLKIQSLNINSSKMEDRIVTLVMNSCRAASEVYLNFPTTLEFDYLNKSLFPKFNLDKLTMHYAGWVTTWHLTNLFMNCKHLDLYNCSTVHINVNQFIKEWVNGSSQLKYAKLTFVDYPMIDILEGIPSTFVTTTGTWWA
ncbi:hypothetical protein CRE_04232 [Caenorhabditis remanei]|uniref:Sdz-33 F-box domain-containing protein n=1 Tax=Caenorhabditis remanei TaxID=31234 RepID=E3MYV7_CAERE|nr:hypothetical protein CRE_04232 [Caenorhabditis remanei]